MLVHVDHELNPLRPVDWRLRKAVEIICENDWTPPRGDYLLRIVQFLRARRRVRDSSQMFVLSRRMQDAFEAFAIYEAGSGDLRSVIEARMLARQSADQIAQMAGVQSPTITFYGAAFFDVQGRLDARDFILQGVILPEMRVGTQRATRHAMWKLVGYLAGPDALEKALYGAVSGQATSLENLSEGLAESARTLAQQRVADLVASPYPSDLQLAAHLQRLAKKPEGKGNSDPQTDYEKAIQAMLDTLPWRLKAGDVDDDRLPAEVRELEEMGVTLRAHELVLLGLGGSLPNVEALKTARFPERTGEGS
jgi:hypothetical protein